MILQMNLLLEYIIVTGYKSKQYQPSF